MGFKKIVLRATRDEINMNESDPAHLKIKIWEDADETLSQYTSKTFSQSQVDHDCQKIITFLNENSRKSGNGESLKKLQGMGSKLADMLLEPSHKAILCSTQAEYLDLKLDDHLVQIPWELLYIGDFFLCERFAIGRRVETRQELVKYQKRPLTYPLKTWIIAPSEKDLVNTEEALNVFKNINSNTGDAPFFEAELDVDVTADQIKEKIRMFDVLHFAGHGIFNSKNPGLSGWKLAGGNLIASDIHNMAGGKALPSIVFSNACQSARTDEWDGDQSKTNSTFGLANAFMYSGVRHYIGTFGDIPDSMSSQVALEFYDNLASGKTIGASLKAARVKLLKGNHNLCWANYLMYGDPTAIYVCDQPDIAPQTFTTAEEQPAEIKTQTHSIPHETFPEPLPTRTDGQHSETPIRTNDQHPETPISPPATKDRTITGKKWLICLLVILLLSAFFIFVKIARKSWVDNWTSQPMTLTVVFKVNGQQVEQRLENMISHTIQIRLKEYGRFTLLERMDIDIILEELKLWESGFSEKEENPNLLKADLYLIIDVKPNQKDVDISMRLIETRSSESKPFHFYERIQGNLFNQRKRIANMTVEMLEKQFPLRGKIRIQDKAIILNIGENVGVKLGQSFKVVGDEIVLKVKGLEKNFCVVAVEGNKTVKAGWKVEAF